MYIVRASTISAQDSFNRPGFSANMKALGPESTLMEPDNLELIHPMALRRMTPVVRMGVATAKTCLGFSEDVEPQGIIIGTGLGGTQSTEQFLQKLEEAQGGLISPTSFSTSTANTVAGQIGLELKNRGYNATHTQSSISFEHALMDARLCLLDQMQSVLVGGVDELGESLFNINARLGRTDLVLGEGGAMFLIAAKPESNGPQIKIEHITCLTGRYNPMDELHSFLTQHGHNSSAWLQADDHLTMYMGDGFAPLSDLGNALEYSQFCGPYLTAPAFGLAVAHDMLAHGNKWNSILLANQLFPEHLGFILVSVA